MMIADPMTPRTATLQPAEQTHAVVAAAARLLDAAAGPAGFALDLFGRVPSEDLAPYAPDALTELAAAAHRHLGVPRGPGAGCGLALIDATVERHGLARELTVLEAVNDNRPFLLDSVLAELRRQGLAPLLVAHPVLGVERDSQGALIGVVGRAAPSAQTRVARESLIHIHLDRIDGDAERQKLRAGLERVFRDVSLASDDQAAMIAGLDALARAYRDAGAALPAGEADAVLSFLAWLRDGNFVFLGMDELDAAPGGAGGPGPALGIIRDPDLGVYDAGRSEAARSFETAALINGGAPVVVTKAAARSTVHRDAFLDCVGLRSRGPARVTWVFGLFTASAYACPTRDVPILRRKLATVVERAGLDPTSHAGRTLLAVLEAYPRDELYQIDPERLLASALAIADLAERPRIRVLQRPDAFGRFASLLVYVPKERCNGPAQARIGAFMADRFGGQLTVSSVLPSDGPLALVHYVVRGPGTAAERDARTLEDGVAAIVRTWGDELRDVLEETLDGRRARALAARYAEAFSGGYRERFTPREALADIAVMEGWASAGRLAFVFGRSGSDEAGHVRLKAFSRGAALPLSDRVPELENLGFRVIDERTYQVGLAAEGAGRVWIHDMLLLCASGTEAALERAGALAECLSAIAAGLTESDGYNQLVLGAGLTWREAALLRAMGRYLRQVRIRYGQDYLAAALAAHPEIAKGIVQLFSARLDPTAPGDLRARETALRARVEGALAEAAGLDEERILRRFLNVVDSTVRTSFFQAARDGSPREALALKLACAQVTGMPLPRPLFEVFVHSPRVEGVHLRFGHVARGGIRWSDRPEDYRTEVLGLVKAQQVKNAVIVPVGAKGGFLPKRLPSPADRAAWMAEGVAAYRIYIGALLDVTDNIVGDAVEAPASTVRLDPDDDAYLVVAADKGTASFSDVANAISAERGHWLGDAFASGGSHGYDHKAMGITARGAWEAVKRHFREIDVDAQVDPLRVVGIGDMSGDVFGNGMLLSRNLRLVAAFDHRHIFLDPEPDAGPSFAERSRLFALPRSSWADYDTALISAGGGVFPRGAKVVPLAPQARAALGTNAAELSPAELVQAILRAPVDLIWFGGIGTYVRSSAEADEAVGDRANDAVRITGSELRAKVVGEGANLGLTQRGRVEAARHGVRLNTDAIDNSAGVNTSDIEVNIKIALKRPEGEGRLGSAARDALLASMTEEVAILALRNNVRQALAISLTSRAGARETRLAMRTMEALETDGRLDRAIEFLPDAAALAGLMQRGESLTRPEFAVVMAYAKLQLHDALLRGDLVDDPYLVPELRGYFPAALRDRFPQELEAHRLRRELIATELSNAIVNDCGPSVATKLADETGREPGAVAKAYLIARDAFAIPDLTDAIDGLSGRIAGQAHLDLRAEIQDFLLGRIEWLVRAADLAGPLAPLVARYREGANAVLAAIAARPSHGLPARAADLVRLGLAEEVARTLAGLDALASAADAADVAQATGCSAADAASALFALDRALDFDGLTRRIRSAPIGDAIDRIALGRAAWSVTATRSALAGDALRGGGSGEDAVRHWIAQRSDALERTRRAIAAIPASSMSLATAVVAAGLLADLAAPPGPPAARRS